MMRQSWRERHFFDRRNLEEIVTRRSDENLEQEGHFWNVLKTE